jgi:Uma2 family endonuclease
MDLQTVERTSSPPESIITLGGITWERFNRIESAFDGMQTFQLTYLAGALEIMAPIGEEHENVKTTVGYLLQAYMREKGIRFYGRGGFTLKKEGYSSSEPDESYCIGTNKKVPDIVIEVIITSGSLNKLEVYKPQNIPEVWFWKNNQLQVFHLKNGEYQEVNRSEFFPDLDFDMLVHYIAYPDQYDAVQAFQAAVRGLK